MDAKRREARRRKIMLNQDDRLKKITGSYEEKISSHVNETPKEGFQDRVPDVDADMYNIATTCIDGEADKENDGWLFIDQKDSVTHKNKVFTEKCSNNDKRTEAIHQQCSHLDDIKIQNSQSLKEDKNSNSTLTVFSMCRFFLSLMAGILVRISLNYSISKDYVQTCVYPFCALEIAFFGYQRAIGMDIQHPVSGGLWLTALSLAGVNTTVIGTYKLLTGLCFLIMEDFAAYCFSFILTHALFT